MAIREFRHTTSEESVHPVPHVELENEPDGGGRPSATDRFRQSRGEIRRRIRLRFTGSVRRAHIEPVLAESPALTILPTAVTPAARPLFQSIKEHALLLFGLLTAMWVVELVDFLLPMVYLDQFGIRPRSERGLLGILLAPFLHVGFGHLLSNSLPFLLLGGLVMTGGRRQFLLVSLWVTLVAGSGVWLLGGSRTVHLGASLLIFGYLGFLLSRGIAARSIGGVLLSLGLLVGYGGMLHGLLPGQPGISWLGHLCGFLAGIAGAWWIGEEGRHSGRVSSMP